MASDLSDSGGAKTNPALFFNAHHAPVGAFATFTLGFSGAKGGLGMELGAPSNESIFIGVETREGGAYEALPFFGSSADSALRYDVESGAVLVEGMVKRFPEDALTREFGLACDTWRARDLTFSIYSPIKPVPEPAAATKSTMMQALVPAVFAELTIDNTTGTRARKAFLGREGSDPRYNTRRLDDVSRGKFTGVGQGTVTAIVSDSAGVYSGTGFTLDQVLKPDFSENLAFGLGGVGALMAEVPAGKSRTFRFAICFYRDGNVTSGLPASYYYTRYFSSIETVAAYALQNWNAQKHLAVQADRTLARAELSTARHFQLCHAVRSYYGSTEFLDAGGKPFWVVNEGEYRMMNTFDLTVDHLFFELDQNPWVVKNQLDWFVRRYSYKDSVRLPGSPKEYPGGISFTHDMGIGNCVSRPGFSSYEKAGLSGCFSHMTHEQLVNWVCCAVSYVKATDDTLWQARNLRTFQACFASLINRDHPDPKQRDGVMSVDSSRCLGGAEITTYDSLDISLGQARNNLYLAVKTWAAYLGLSETFRAVKNPKLAAQAEEQAKKCGQTIASHLRDDGFIPAVMGEGNESRIIPAIEGLIFPLVWKLDSALSADGTHGRLIRALKTHLQTILVLGMCKFPDGGWKLSSTSDNSWLSKIYLSQHVANAVYGVPPDDRADEAHRSWLLDPDNAYFAWSDQMVAGKAKGSKYYPRGVTAWLWLSNLKPRPVRTAKVNPADIQRRRARDKSLPAAS